MVPEFTKEYFPQLNREAFSSAGEQLEAWYLFVDMLCAVSLYEIDGKYAGRRERAGSLMSYLEADELIAPPQKARKESQEPDFPETFRRSVREVFDALLAKGYDKGRQAVSPLSRLFLRLDSLEVLATVLALAATHSRKYERVFALLSEERNGVVRPTIGLCADLGRYFLDERERGASKLFAGDSFFTRYVLERDSAVWDSQLSHVLALRSEALSLVLGGRMEAVLPACMTRLAKPGSGFSIHGESFGEIMRLVAKRYAAGSVAEAAGAPAEACGFTMVQLIGERGAGKRYLISSVGQELGVPVLAVDVRLLADSGEAGKCSDILVLLAAMEDAIVYLHQFPEEGEEHLEEIRMLLAAFSRERRLCFAGVEARLPERIESAVDGPVYRITLPSVSSLDQQLLWRAAAAENGARLAPDLDLGQIVSKYAMNPGRIYAAMTNATLSAEEGRAIGVSLLEEQIRRVCSVEFGENATKLSSPFTWKDLMVGSTSEHMLRLAVDRIRCRAAVLEGFGFSRKLPYGRGVAIALYGPPGTGKTMAAQVLANELGLDIYRVDLSQVSSKYIGETEKNLGSIFSAAKRSNAVLFFDEADSLFSKRTEIASSNDKYANAETSYLLQKIEEYDGVSVLATNNMQNFDAAFKRRMTYIIPLEAPDAETRRRLWENVFPAGVPLDKRIDFGLLASCAELSGAQIKAVALACSYQAAANERSIVYQDFIEMIDLECAKTGTLHAGEKLRQEVMMM